jgi:histidinol-phosphate aminotransferase
MIDIETLIRKNIKALLPYATARHEFVGNAQIYLDANENAYGTPIHTNFNTELDISYNRYPDPLQEKLKQKISSIKGIPTQNIFIGNGSDEAIDILQRIFCEPAIDNIIICPPTYGMYKVSADINNVAVKSISLLNNYQLNLESIMNAIDDRTKMIFICSPNNPTGNSIHKNDIEFLLNNFNRIVVLDEAYINYNKQKSFISGLTVYSNLVILQTLSKAWGMAGLRIGMAYGSTLLIEYMNKVKYPYNISQAAQQLAITALNNVTQVNNWIKECITQRGNVENHLLSKPYCIKIVPSDANFILVALHNANELYKYLCNKGTIVRDRSKIELCENCLRITIGTAAENIILLNQIDSFYKN